MKGLTKKIFALTAVLTTLVAATVASSACCWFAFQPEEPEALREE